ARLKCFRTTPKGFVMPDTFHGSGRPATVLEGTPRDLSATTPPLPYRGCTPVSPRTGTARTTPLWIVRAAGHDHGAGRPRPVAAIRLELGDMPWAGVPCWSGGAQRWAQETVPIAYKLRYDSHVRPAMPGNPISLTTLVRVAQARAEHAGHRT